MKKKYILIITGIGFLTAFFIFFQIYVPRRIENLINSKISELNHVNGNIEHVDISFFSDDWTLYGVNIISNTNKTKNGIQIEKVKLTNINLYSALFQDKIDVGLIKLIKPDINITKIEGKVVTSKPFREVIEIGGIEIEDGTIAIFESQKKDTIFSSKISSVKLNAITLGGNEPFYFNDSLIDFVVITDLQTKINSFDVLKINRLSLKNDTLLAGNLSISTELGRAQLSEVLTNERDHTTFNLEVLEIKKLYFQVNDKLSSISSSRVSLSNFNLELYRDKRIADDTKRKQYYGELLRNLPFKLNIDTITVKEGSLNYAEKIKPGIKPKNLVFQNISGEFNNIQNFQDSQISVDLSAQIMGEAKLEINYKLNPMDLDESFLLKGSLNDLITSSINPFLRTSTGTTAQGSIDQMYFTMDGNSTIARGDVKMKYEDFEIQILKKDLLKINKVLSFLGNLIINDGSNGDENGYRYGDIEVEPDGSKSFINYLWVCLMDGMLDTVTGNGKKE